MILSIGRDLMNCVPKYRYTKVFQNVFLRKGLYLVFGLNLNMLKTKIRCMMEKKAKK